MYYHAMDLERELDIHLRSRFTLICIVGVDEERAIAKLSSLCQRSERTALVWDHADGFQQVSGPKVVVPNAEDALTALDAIDRLQGQVVVVLRDFHQCWERQPRVIRKLRNLAQRFKFVHKSLIVTMPTRTIPEELKDDAVVLECPPPELTELDAILKHLLKTPGVKSSLTAEQYQELLRAALGLSSGQAQRVFARAIVTGGGLDVDDLALVIREKQNLVRASGALELFHAVESIGNVGGLDALKQWLRQRARAFGREAQAYGLPAPKGIALIGIPGSGKSLTAKTIASLWHLPLLRLDIGALFGNLVGQSEENTRRALELAETVSPCVLWIDEIEKGLSTGDGDGGTSLRVFGAILSWMQEKTKPVFIVATANDISRLPPELLRRGRFDEVFFLDLPTDVERHQIFQVHIRKRKRDPALFALPRLVAASAGYVGAEIEQSVIDALYLAFNDEKQPGREPTTEDVLAALARLVPMSRSQRERIEYLRQWLHEGRANSASFQEMRQAEQSFVPIPLSPLGK